MKNITHAAVFSFLVAASLPAASAPQIVILPDTQNYTGHAENQHILRSQAEWVRDNIESEEIAFVTHVGDIVGQRQTTVPWEDQWVVADEMLSLFHGEVPYSITYGNHDFDVFGDSASGAEAAQQYFSGRRYRNEDWFMAYSLDRTSFAQLLQIDGVRMIHLALKYDPDLATLDWARALINGQPGTPVVITTHSYLQDAGLSTRTGEVMEQGRGMQGERIWEQLVRGTDQVFLVIGGHFHFGDDVEGSGEYNDDGEFHQVSINDAGNEVFEVLASYQDYPNGGDGWLQLLTLDTDNNRIAVRTYSPYLDKFQDDENSSFEWSVNLGERWGLE
jgi:hypothetical protein